MVRFDLLGERGSFVGKCLFRKRCADDLVLVTIRFPEKRPDAFRHWKFIWCIDVSEADLASLRRVSGSPDHSHEMTWKRGSPPPRRATSDDIAAVAALHRLAFFQAMPHMQRLHTPEEDAAFYANAVFPNAQVWLCEREGEVAGFIAFRSGWVDHLYVHPKHQRHGIGSELLALAQSAEDCLRLWTFQCNHPASRFYEAHGFRIERKTCGSGNEERQPDILYHWSRSPLSQMNPAPHSPASPEAVVQRQLDAYNAHDLHALIAAYAEDARLFEHPATLLAAGSGQIRERFAARFAEPNLHAHLLSRAVMGRFVVDHERVSRTFPEGTGKVELIATYEVLDGKIANAWFLSGPKTLDAASQQSNRSIP